MLANPYVVRCWNVGKVVVVFVFIAVAASFTIANAAEPAPAAKCNYERPFEPPTRSAFIPLAARRDRARGLAARLVHRLQRTDTRDTWMSVDIAFRQAWASDYKMTGEHVSLWDRGGWPYEGGGYWFEGLAKLGYVLHDKALIDQAKIAARCGC